MGERGQEGWMMICIAVGSVSMLGMRLPIYLLFSIPEDHDSA